MQTYVCDVIFERERLVEGHWISFIEAHAVGEVDHLPVVTHFLQIQTNQIHHVKDESFAYL